MNPDEPRILFDECLPPPFVNRLVEFLKPKEGDKIVIRSILKFAPSGTRDEDWIPRIKDGGWTVVSADGGRQPNKARGKKLPALCIEHGVTLILLSPAVHNRKVLDKTRTILSVWDKIIEIASTPALQGKRFLLEPADQHSLGTGRISEKPIRPRRD